MNLVIAYNYVGPISCILHVLLHNYSQLSWTPWPACKRRLRSSGGFNGFHGTPLSAKLATSSHSGHACSEHAQFYEYVTVEFC